MNKEEIIKMMEEKEYIETTREDYNKHCIAEWIYI
jgi:hypothetical protein